MKLYDEAQATLHNVPGFHAEPPDISVFLPVFNEEPNLRPLHEKLTQSLAQLGRTAEIIYVDDGSSDCSAKKLRPDTGDGGRHSRGARKSFDSDGCRFAKRSGRHQALARQTRRR